jgi:hypothetical protein
MKITAKTLSKLKNHLLLKIDSASYYEINSKRKEGIG